MVTDLSRGRWFEPGSKEFLIILPMIPMITVLAIAEIGAGAVVFHPSATTKYV